MRNFTLTILCLTALCLSVFAPAHAQKAELVVQLGHTDSVNSVAYSPDGKTLASAGGDKTIKLWNVATGQLLRTLQGHSGGISSVSFAPDGKTLASAGHYTGAGGSDNAVRVWDVETGQLLRTSQGHTESIEIVAYSPDGKTLASGAYDNTAKIWDAATGKLRHTLQVHTDAVRSLCYSPDGKTLATGSSGHIVKIWDTATGKVLRTLQGPIREEWANTANWVSSIKYSPDGKTLACTNDDTIIFWELATGKLLRTLRGHDGFVERIAYSTDGETLVSGGADKTLKIWDVATGKLRRTLQGHAQGISSIAYSPDGKTLASAETGSWNSSLSGDNAVKIWDVTTGKLLRALQGHNKSVGLVAYAPDGKTLACAQAGHWGSTVSEDKTVKIWDVATGKPLRILQGHTDGVTSIAYAPDSKTLALGNDKDVELWEVATGQMRHTFQGHTERVFSVSYAPDGKTLASGSYDKTVKLWDVATGQLLRTLQGHGEYLSQVLYAPDGKTLACAQVGPHVNIVELWDAKTGKLLRTLQSEGAGNLSYSPDGKTLALAGSNDKAVKLWDAETGKLLRTLRGHTESVGLVAYAPDGKTLASASDDKTIKLWDAATGKLLHSLQGHTDTIRSIAYAPDSKTLTSASDDTSIRFWNVGLATPTALTTYSFDSGDSVEIDPQGRFDGTPGGLEQLHYVVGLEPIALDQLKERYYQPGLWGKVMGGDADPTLRDVAAFGDVALYPEVEVVAPAPGDTKLTVRLTRRSGGYGRVEVKVGETNLTGDARPRGLDGDAATQTFTVDLAGSNISAGQKVPIEVVAWNRDGDVRSRGVKLESFVMPGEAQQSKPRFFAIVVGTSQFANKSLNLRFAAKDATDFARALDVATPPALFESKRIALLTTDATDANLQPSKANISAAFASVARDAREDDVVVLYFSGHGIGLVRDGKNFYCYLTRDALSASETAFKDAAVLNASTVNSADLDEWLTGPNRIKALKRVLILDTCAAGAFAAQQPLAEQKDVSSDIVLALDKLHDNTGYHVLMGCAASASSYEANRYAQGLLTYSLLKYLKFDGRADGREVDVNRLFRFAEKSASEMAKLNHLSQQPRIIAGDNTFPIGLLEDERRKDVPLAGEKPVLLRPAFINPARRFDNLKLSGAVQARLREICATEARGAATPVYVDVDWEEYADGLQPAGNYHIEGDKVIAELVLVRGGQEGQPFVVEGPAADDKRGELVEAIVMAILKAQGA